MAAEPKPRLISYELAVFVRRLMHDPEFDTFAERAGKIVSPPKESHGGNRGDHGRG